MQPEEIECRSVLLHDGKAPHHVHGGTHETILATAPATSLPSQQGLTSRRAPYPSTVSQRINQSGRAAAATKSQNLRWKWLEPKWLDAERLVHVANGSTALLVEKCVPSQQK